MFMALIVIIGAVVFYFEQKNKKSYQRVFDDFFDKISHKSSIKKEQKLFLAMQMLEKNGYTTSQKDATVTAKKKIFSLGLFLMSFGLYLLYYFYLQKPHTVTFNCKS